MEKKRLQYIDIAKGICILLVVIGHILQYNFEGSAKDSAFSFIYSFHMPVFMLLSGYVAALSHRRIDRIEASNFIKKKFLSLVVPFCTWGLLLTPFVIDQHPFAELLPTAKNLFLYPSTGAWFIIVLFCFQLYFLLFRSMTERFLKTISLKSDGISFMVVFGLLSLASQAIKHCNETIVGGVDKYFSLRFFIFFMLGYFFQRYWQKTIFNKWVCFTSLILFLLLVREFKYGFSSLSLQMSISICASVVVLNLSRVLEEMNVRGNSHTLSWLIRIGKKSLAIYLTHYAIIIAMQKELLSTGNLHAIPLFLLCGAMAIVASMLCVKWAELIEKFPLLNTLLYGHIYKRK